MMFVGNARLLRASTSHILSLLERRLLGSSFIRHSRILRQAWRSTGIRLCRLLRQFSIRLAGLLRVQVESHRRRLQPQ